MLLEHQIKLHSLLVGIHEYSGSAYLFITKFIIPKIWQVKLMKSLIKKSLPKIWQVKLMKIKV